MNRKYLVMAGLLALSACASEPSQTLEQKLQGKSADEKKEVLRLACLNEAEWPIYNSSGYRAANPRLKSQLKLRYNEEVSTSKELCRKLEDATDPQTKKALAKEGQFLIAATLEKHGDAATDHAARTKQIYEKMTTEKLPSNTLKR